MNIQKSEIAIFVLNQSPISAVFQIVQLPGDQKTALTGESLYIEGKRIHLGILITFLYFQQIESLHEEDAGKFHEPSATAVSATTCN